jgi:hypothetical protein
MTTQDYLYKIIVPIYLYNVTIQDYLYMIAVEGLSLYMISVMFYLNSGLPNQLKLQENNFDYTTTI